MFGRRGTQRFAWFDLHKTALVAFRQDPLSLEILHRFVQNKSMFRVSPPHPAAFKWFKGNSISLCLQITTK